MSDDNTILVPIGGGVLATACIGAGYLWGSGTGTFWTGIVVAVMAAVGVALLAIGVLAERDDARADERRTK